MNRKLKGSGILVVVLSAVVFTIYANANFSYKEHFSILQKKYESDIISMYEKNVDDIDNIYDNLVITNANSISKQ